MANILYFTPEEKGFFDALPAGVKSSWKGTVQIEKLTSFETKEELLRRMQALSYSKMPAMKPFVEKLASAVKDQKEFDAIKLEDFPQEGIAPLLYAIGASGMTAMISLTLLSDECTTEALEGLAVLTGARHQVLMSNTFLTA